MSVGPRKSQRGVSPFLAFVTLAAAALGATQLAGCSSGAVDPCADGGGKGCFPLKAGPISHVNADCVASASTSTCSLNETCYQDNDFPRGACTELCKVGDDTTCNFGGKCLNLADGPFCVRTCDSDADCAASARCTVLPGQAQSICVPTGVPVVPQVGSCPLAPNLLVGGAVTNPDPGGTCVRPVVASSFPAGGKQTFGAHRVGDVVSFDVAPNTASITILSQAIDAGDTINGPFGVQDNTVVPTQLALPDDAGVLYDDVVIPNGPSALQPVFFASNSPSTSALTVPNTSDLLFAVQANGGFPSGKWSFQVNDYAAECTIPSVGCDGGSLNGVYDITVLTKAGPPSGTGNLELGIYLVGAKLPTAANAVNDEHMKRFVQTIHDIYAKAGVCVSTVTFFDVPAWAKQRYATGVNADLSGACTNLDQMFTLSAPGNRINLFLVDDIVSTKQAGFSVIGIDGTIPGPSSLGGTISSGAAVNGAAISSGVCGATLDLGNCGADFTAYIAAHEAGHFLGLYHTSESTGESFDPLLDTPTCKCELCVGKDKVAACAAASDSVTRVEATDCNQAGSQQCGGGDNLMFWLVDAPNNRLAISKGLLTGEQSKVMVANPVVQ